ncbi:helicase-related protein, partial [Corynebacterium riegelii]
PWKELEMAGYIATAECVEVRTTLTAEERLVYASAETRERYRLAACSRGKLEVVEKLLAQHAGKQTLIIGAYVDQLEEIAQHIGAQLIDGTTSTKKRETAFQAFRDGEISTLVVSKVANFSIDLPEAAVAIQVSGTFGSRQEEAQRLGRLLRPKADGAEALFYTVVARDTLDAEYALRRQRFLAEQGYAYRLVDADDI